MSNQNETPQPPEPQPSQPQPPEPQLPKPRPIPSKPEILRDKRGLPPVDQTPTMPPVKPPKKD